MAYLGSMLSNKISYIDIALTMIFIIKLYFYLNLLFSYDIICGIRFPPVLKTIKHSDCKE